MTKNALGQEEKPPKFPYQHFTLAGTPALKAPLTAGACVWFYKKLAGEIFVLAQKRALTVHNGGFYDTSAGGHVDEGEEPLVAALRESKEEIGITLTEADLEFLCAYRVPDKIIYIYLSDRTGKDDTFTLNYEEVESVEWIALKDLPAFAEKHIKPSLRKEKFHLTFLADTLSAKL